MSTEEKGKMKAHNRIVVDESVWPAVLDMLDLEFGIDPKRAGFVRRGKVYENSLDGAIDYLEDLKNDEEKDPDAGVQ